MNHYSSETGATRASRATRTSRFCMKKQDKREAHNFFINWFVGFIDGQGSFIIKIFKSDVTFTCKISLTQRNIQALYHMKKLLRCGTISKTNADNMVHYRIWRLEHLHKIIIPLFNYIPLKTILNQDFLIFRHCFMLYMQPNKEMNVKIHEIIDYRLNPPLMCLPRDTSRLSKPWIIGFTEAEGSFYLVRKSSFKIVHGFLITLSTLNDRFILEEIREIIGVISKVTCNKNGFWSLDATGKKDIKRIKDYYFKSFKGVTSLYYRIWARSFRDKGKYSKLLTIQEHLRRIKKGQ
jgi:hypothetical protein